VISSDYKVVCEYSTCPLWFITQKALGEENTLSSSLLCSYFSILFSFFSLLHSDILLCILLPLCLTFRHLFRNLFVFSVYYIQVSSSALSFCFLSLAFMYSIQHGFPNYSKSVIFRWRQSSSHTSIQNSAWDSHTALLKINILYTGWEDRYSVTDPSCLSFLHHIPLRYIWSFLTAHVVTS
jgi:hypothetical protein